MKNKQCQNILCIFIYLLSVIIVLKKINILEEYQKS